MWHSFSFLTFLLYFFFFTNPCCFGSLSVRFMFKFSAFPDCALISADLLFWWCFAGHQRFHPETQFHHRVSWPSWWMSRSRTFEIDVSTFVAIMSLFHTHERFRDCLRVRLEFEKPALAGLVCSSIPWSVRDWRRLTLTWSSLIAPHCGWLGSAAVFRLVLMFVIFWSSLTRLCSYITTGIFTNLAKKN